MNNRPEIIKAIIGLGNPGNKFFHTRHNIGFRILDAIAGRLHVSWGSNDLMDYAETFMGDTGKIILIKPKTFMNSSGKVIPFLTKKGIKPEEILVVHDELEKPFGNIGIKLGGSAKGHNGLRSIIGVIGKDFWRARFGIGRPENQDVSDYVLDRFSPKEEQEIPALIEELIGQLLP